MAKVIAVVTQINGNGTEAVADVSYSLDTIAFSASIQVSLSALTSQADVVEIIKNAVLTDVNTRGIGTYTYSDIILVSTGATGSFGRDVIVSSKVTSGNSDFFSVSSLTLTLEADSTDPFIYDIGGVQFKQTADITLAVTDNAHNFIWINNLGAMGRVATPCTYSFTAPGAPATGDMWYDLGKQQMKEWSGAAWVAVFRIMIGYVRADSGSINARYACAPIGVTPEARFAAFGPGTDGFLDVTGTTTIDHSKFYTAVVVRGTGTIVHTTGISVALRVKAQECISLVGTSGIDLSGRGRPAGNGQTGTGSGGAGNALGGAGGGGGGGTNAGGVGGNRNDASAFVGTGQGTAGGAGGGTGGNGTASPLDSTDGDTIYQFGQGGGGGGGGGDNTSAGGNGGRGGGNGSFFSPTIAIGASATMNANGGNGTAGGGANRGGGGAGGGGIIQAICRNFFNSGTFSANSGTVGASGGAGSGAGGSGGAGVAALVRV